MAGILDGYFANPQTGILGGVFAPLNSLYSQSGAPPGVDAFDPKLSPQDTGGSLPQLAPLLYALGLAPGARAPSAASASPAADDGAGIGANSATGRSADGGAAGSDVLGRIGQALRDNSSMLMAMGGGMITGGVGKGFEAGAAASAGDAKRQADAASRDATMQALLQAGVPPAVAQAAAANPALLRAITARMRP